MGETPLVLDREFSAQIRPKAVEEAKRKWVVRLNVKSGVKFADEPGEEIPLSIEKGEKRNVEGAYYRERGRRTWPAFGGRVAGSLYGLGVTWRPMISWRPT